ncbi:gluconate 2-dehydrogenase subunit 3 family protein [Candidatus Sulfurimonas marisnigri]|uniref:Gluconate 2-dehydrogenase subunit 3 family protein n=1 Tax=Candidatus Sulfurimonas marisnigri TaxID=2740405 RepID=A0A7S7M0F9_9BACT|nr:gluconate 2-dehydrogenase subunit 3 family protein [Candidatus Sulfurimonas marisnigri]QOY54772.1 gluconate 2-dehydrogenase subunit 3 family protein [Candidatus Sulfurimonas marisnigri]
MIFNSRRLFLKNSFLSSIVFVTYGSELFGVVTPMQTISLVQRDLFPSTPLFPHVKDINATYCLTKILSHSRVTDEDKAFIKDGVKWLNEEAVTKYKKLYSALSWQQRQETLQDIADTDWGESWIKTIMGYIFEAMLGDPIYGGNKGEIGWKWLNHKSGLPRPKKELL